MCVVVFSDHNRVQKQYRHHDYEECGVHRLFEVHLSEAPRHIYSFFFYLTPTPTMYLVEI